MSEAPATASGDHHISQDIQDLHQFGYPQKLRRTIGSYTSFALGFSMITITTTIFTLFAQPFQTIGGVAIWLWGPGTPALPPLPPRPRPPPPLPPLTPDAPHTSTPTPNPPAAT